MRIFQRLETNEKGVAMVETLAVAPILIAVGLFSADLFLFSKSRTDLNQATRDAAIFFAMYPNTSGADSSFTDAHQSQSWADSCIIDPSNISEDRQQDIDECEHISTQERAYRLLEAQNSYLDINRQNVHISTSKTGNKVQLTISANLKTSFFFTTKTLTSTAILRKIV